MWLPLSKVIHEKTYVVPAEKPDNYLELEIALEYDSSNLQMGESICVEVVFAGNTTVNGEDDIIVRGAAKFNFIPMYIPSNSVVGTINSRHNIVKSGGSLHLADFSGFITRNNGTACRLAPENFEIEGEMVYQPIDVLKLKLTLRNRINYDEYVQHPYYSQAYDPLEEGEYVDVNVKINIEKFTVQPLLQDIEVSTMHEVTLEVVGSGMVDFNGATYGEGSHFIAVEAGSYIVSDLMGTIQYWEVDGMSESGSLIEITVTDNVHIVAYY